jgi:hypothetical protein
MQEKLKFALATAGVVAAVGAISVASAKSGAPKADPAPTSGYTKDQCKNGGWQTNFPAGTFKNQGDCVSFFATGGKNPPSGPEH